MKTTIPSPKLTELLSGTLTEEEALEIYDQGKDAVVWALLSLQKRVDELSRVNATGEAMPSSPSSTIPPYLKPQSKRKAKRSGARPGHVGHRRSTPEPDEVVDLTLPCCPECGGEVTKCRSSKSTRTRIVEDISPAPKVKITQYDIHGYWCSHCGKVVEPKVTAALPSNRIGNRTIALTAWLHYGLGNTIAQILDVLNYHLSITVTSGGLLHLWNRAAEILAPWYEEIRTSCLESGVLHADESGWRVDGQTEWLWCFATPKETYYLIHPTRSEQALNEFFKDYFDGVLVSDFYAAYNSVECLASQKCLVHLLRELEKIELYKDTSDNWNKFKSQLKRLIRDSIKLKSAKADLVPEDFERKRSRLFKRLDELLDFTSDNEEVVRLVKRLDKYRDHILTFLDYDDVPPDNNLAERSIRPAVLMRKTQFGNRSESGAETQAILMSVFRSLKQRGINPSDAVRVALCQYALSETIPSLNDVVNLIEAE